MATDTFALSLRQLEEFDPRASQGGAERRFLCPLCGEGKPKDSAHRSLGLNTQSGAWVCHRCGEKGKLAEWKDEKPINGKTLRRQKLRRAFSLDATSPKVSALPLVGTRNSTVLSPAPPALSACADTPESTLAPAPVWRRPLKNLVPLAGTPGEKYLQKRGIALEAAHAAGVRFSPSWFGRPAVVFPVRDAGSTLVAAQGRYISQGKGPKARTTGDKKAGVFVTAGFWEDVKRGAPVVICEAPIDALSIALCGFPALALCGKDGWPDWLPVKCAFKSVALAFDADEAGDMGAEKLYRVLGSLGAKPFRLRPEGGKDWNEVLCSQGMRTLSDWLALALL
jgi:hypothetical protein